ncbi:MULTISPECIES: dihydrofolate reductase family protein [unclassified Exiguobacterium]|uniref:Bifunctional deaminase-reductase domain protein n=1 Tax=Exiguobacterium sp. (strain ATCC BAA-1283 / AT1b) TaxID=360911 RepID=C4L684_EXISA|nr:MULTISPECIES: dihydrofolate reductase family protein [unclassified Exiguobacterium]ACQ69915.1 bifunctional deaminase-reductase domain protein [Exiguobacterium sp. AT1b]
MRKIIVLEHLSLDGVIQAPGGKEEDLSGDFMHGGWTEPFSSQELGIWIRTQMHSEFDLLLGRKTYAQWASYWPNHDDIWPEANRAMKYVITRQSTDSRWESTTFLTEPVEALKRLKQEEGPDLHVWGSGELVHTLLANNLIDEVRLIVYPIIIGSGKRLFPDGNILPLQLDVIEQQLMPNGVHVVRYGRLQSEGEKR